MCSTGCSTNPGFGNALALGSLREFGLLLMTGIAFCFFEREFEREKGKKYLVAPTIFFFFAFFFTSSFFQPKTKSRGTTKKSFGPTQCYCESQRRQGKEKVKTLMIVVLMRNKAFKNYFLSQNWKGNLTG